VLPKLATILFGAAAFLGCPGEKPDASRADSERPEASNTEDAAEARAPKAAPSSETWTGTYDSHPGSIYVVDGGEWAGVRWRGDDASVGLGEGKLSLAMNRTSEEVRGTGEGPIGNVVLSGVVTGGAITLSVSRKDPLDRGLTGTAVAQVSGDKISGTMRLSQADARVIREATLHLVREASP
jgi:hypothetical protein